MITDLVIFSQDIYCGGYSGEDPPLPIPNREVKLTIADGTAPPGGRVGSCHFLLEALRHMSRSFFVFMVCGSQCIDRQSVAYTSCRQRGAGGVGNRLSVSEIAATVLLE